MRKTGTSERPDWPLAVVIGAGGMGMAVARRLSQRHRILIADIDGVRVGTAASNLRSEGGDVTSIECDVTNRAAVAELSNKVKELGGFRALAHVAGLSPSASDFTTIVRVNLTGPALVTEALLPLASTGAVNVVSPDSQTNKTFTKALGKAIHRPTVFPVPSFAIKMLYGEMGSTVTEGSNPDPSKLQQLGYGYNNPRLEDALHSELR